MSNVKKVDYNALKRRVKVAMNIDNADLVFKNAKYVNVFTESIEVGDIAVADGYIVGIGNYDGKIEIDCKNKILAPALMDICILSQQWLVQEVLEI